MILKLITIASVLYVSAAFPRNQKAAEDCVPENCQPPNCRCSSTNIPGGLAAAEIPQLVYLTFDDAVTNAHYEKYFSKFIGKSNPDGCPISPTYFMAHEYTDYSVVHTLHAAGHEIALHSVTHNTSTEHWKTLSLDGYILEFDGERQIVSNFAQIPLDNIQGVRIPFLQGSGDTSYQMLKETGLMYDCTWPTQSQTDPGLWPYTLDYESTQDCSIGPCPTASIPGIWVAPMLNWRDDDGNTCAMTDACVVIPDTQAELTQYMIRNFERSYNGNRAPFGFFVHAAWFDNEDHPYRWPAYLAFVDYINNLSDVYIVGITRAIQWVKNPQTIENLPEVWPECQPNYPPTCNAITCEVTMAGDENRRYWFKHCASTCPKVYPWLGNPLGQE